MTLMHANEARRTAEGINQENYNRIIGTIDSGIESAIYEGRFHYTTKALKNDIKDNILSKYKELGYIIVDNGNYQYTIEW